MAAKIDTRFEDVLFAKIDRINTAGDYPVIWFSKPTDTQSQDHKYTRDKTQYNNCYKQLKEGTHYIINPERYEVGRKVRWVWAECIEIPTRVMWINTFNLWREHKDLKIALQESGAMDYMKAERAKKQHIDSLLKF